MIQKIQKSLIRECLVAFSKTNHAIESLMLCRFQHFRKDICGLMSSWNVIDLNFTIVNIVLHGMVETMATRTIVEKAAKT